MGLQQMTQRGDPFWVGEHSQPKNESLSLLDPYASSSSPHRFDASSSPPPAPLDPSAVPPPCLLLRQSASPHPWPPPAPSPPVHRLLQTSGGNCCSTAPLRIAGRGQKRSHVRSPEPCTSEDPCSSLAATITGRDALSTPMTTPAAAVCSPCRTSSALGLASYSCSSSSVTPARDPCSCSSPHVEQELHRGSSEWQRGNGGVPRAGQRAAPGASKGGGEGGMRESTAGWEGGSEKEEREEEEGDRN